MFLFISLSMNMGPTDEPPPPHRHVTRVAPGECPPPFSSCVGGTKTGGRKKEKGGKEGRKRGKGAKKKNKLDYAPRLTKKKKIRFLCPTYKEEKEI